MKLARYSVVALLMVFTLGCAGMTSQQQRTLSGGAIGAAGGAALTAIAGGNAAVGATLGGAAGALTGFILGEQEKHQTHYHKKKKAPRQ
jgi:osmotically inducible lipoprotein OsmB